MKKHAAIALFMVSLTSQSFATSYVKLSHLHPNSATLVLHPGATDVPTCQNLCTLYSDCDAVIYHTLFNGCYLYKDVNGWKAWSEGDSYVKE